MARGYPQFIYSNPKNTKSKGPFLVRTLFPKALFLITKRKSPSHRYPQDCVILEKWDEASEKDYEEAQLLANMWLDRQIKSGEIEF